MTTNGGRSQSPPRDDGRVGRLTALSTWVRRRTRSSSRLHVRCSAGLTTSSTNAATRGRIRWREAPHPAARELDRLARLGTFEALQNADAQGDLTTIQLVWRESPDRSGHAIRSRSAASSGPGDRATTAAPVLSARPRRITPPAIRDRARCRDGPAEPADGLGRARRDGVRSGNAVPI